MAKPGKPTVLLGVADAAARAKAARALSAAGLRVAEFGDGPSAAAHLLLETPDLMVLDANLPGLGGTELCFRTKRVAQLREVPVVVLAFPGDDGARRRAARSGAERVLAKPVAPGALTRAAADLLGVMRDAG